MRTFICSYDVPHLGLALGVMAFCRQLVIRMDLDGKVALGINELYEERELIAGIGIYLFPYELALELLDKFCDGLASGYFDQMYFLVLPLIE